MTDEDEKSLGRMQVLGRLLFCEAGVCKLFAEDGEIVVQILHCQVSSARGTPEECRKQRLRDTD
jgi:hypothetical protein